MRGAIGHLTTSRLTLVPPVAADPDAIVDAIGDFEVSRWLGRVPHPYSRADAEAFQRHCRDNATPAWIALDGEGVAGGVSADDELGYWVARRAWGQGYATEMSCAVIDTWFSDPAAGSLRSGHFDGNTRSRRVLDRLGFLPNGFEKRGSLPLGRSVLFHRMTLGCADWAQVRLRIAPK